MPIVSYPSFPSIGGMQPRGGGGGDNEAPKPVKIVPLDIKSFKTQQELANRSKPVRSERCSRIIKIGSRDDISKSNGTKSNETEICRL
jgi:hypothetical protein